MPSPTSKIELTPQYTAIKYALYEFDGMSTDGAIILLYKCLKELESLSGFESDPEYRRISRSVLKTASSTVMSNLRIKRSNDPLGFDAYAEEIAAVLMDELPTDENTRHELINILSDIKDANRTARANNEARSPYQYYALLEEPYKFTSLDNAKRYAESLISRPIPKPQKPTKPLNKKPPTKEPDKRISEAPVPKPQKPTKPLNKKPPTKEPDKRISEAPVPKPTKPLNKKPPTKEPDKRISEAPVPATTQQSKPTTVKDNEWIEKYGGIVTSCCLLALVITYMLGGFTAACYLAAIEAAVLAIAIYRLFKLPDA